MTCGGGRQERSRSIDVPAQNNGTNCTECEDASTTGDCDLLAIVGTYNMTLVDTVCNDGGGVNGVASTLCEETCDSIVGGFCPGGPGSIDYQPCNTGGCPGNLCFSNL